MKEGLIQNAQGAQAVKAGKPTMQQYIKQMEGEIAKALPSVITPERFTRITLSALSANKQLAQTTPQSFLGAMMTAAQLGIGNLYPVKANAFLYLKSCTKQFDVIFSDAPYDLEGSEQVVKLVLEGNLLRPEGIFIFEHSKKMDFSACEEFWQLRSYGSVQFSFFKKP